MKQKTGNKAGTDLQRTIKVSISKSEGYFVAECLEIAAVTQGRTLDETVANLQEAVGLFLEGEDPEEFGLVKNPFILATLEIPLTNA